MYALHVTYKEKKLHTKLQLYPANSQDDKINNQRTII